VDHEQATMGIPYVQAREKSQGFDGFWHETLRFLILWKLEWRRYVRCLREIHRRRANRAFTAGAAAPAATSEAVIWAGCLALKGRFLWIPTTGFCRKAPSH